MCVCVCGCGLGSAQSDWKMKFVKVKEGLMHSCVSGDLLVIKSNRLETHC